MIMEQNTQATGGSANCQPPAPKLTPSDIERAIVTEHYFTAAEGLANREVAPLTGDVIRSLDHVTFCVLILANGAKVTGVNYGPVSAANFNPQIGREYARKAAVEKVWELEGYLLRDKLSRGDINQHAAEQERARRDLILSLCDVLGCEIDQLLYRVALTSEYAKSGSFGWAIAQLKIGNKIARAGWNGKGMWVGLHKEGGEFTRAECGTVVTYSDYVVLKTADNKLIPWNASQADMLSEDWVLVE